MLRKEIKELAQRVLKGKYGTWAPFSVLPVAVIMIFVFIGFITMGFFAYVSSDYSSGYHYKDDDRELENDDSHKYDDDNDYDDYFDDYDDYDEYDEYDDYDYSYFTPAYNYGYSLGTQAGYLEGWEDGLAGKGDGYQIEEDQEIIDDIKDKPVEFLYSEDFDEGFLDAYSYSYTEAWDDAKKHKKEVKNLSADAQKHTPQMMAVSKIQLTDRLQEDSRDRIRSSSHPSSFAAVTLFAFFLFLLVISFAYQIFYQALLSWAAIDTVDGEKFDFRSMVSEVVSRGKEVFRANFKIYFFTFAWSLLFVIPGLVKWCSYRMTNYLMKREPDLDANSAIVLSQELMKGYKMEFLIFQASFFFWFLAQAYTFGLGCFYVLPYYSTSEAIFFDEIYYEKRKLKQYPSSHDKKDAFDF